MRGVEIVGGGPAGSEEVAAIIAALEVVLGDDPAPPAPSPWGWAGRQWRYDDRGADWRDRASTAHPSRP